MKCCCWCVVVFVVFVVFCYLLLLLVLLLLLLLFFAAPVAAAAAAAAVSGVGGAGCNRLWMCDQAVVGGCCLSMYTTVPSSPPNISKIPTRMFGPLVFAPTCCFATTPAGENISEFPALQ